MRISFLNFHPYALPPCPPTPSRKSYISKNERGPQNLPPTHMVYLADIIIKHFPLK